MNVNRVLYEAYPRNAVTAAAQTSVGAAAGTLLAASTTRKGFVITNTGTTTIYITYGSSVPTTSAYHVALVACTSANDGKGGVLTEDAWQGVVQAIGSAGGGTCVILEITGGNAL